jgi:hypothetical protein
MKTIVTLLALIFLLPAVSVQAETGPYWAYVPGGVAEDWYGKVYSMSPTTHNQLYDCPAGEMETDSIVSSVYWCSLECRSEQTWRSYTVIFEEAFYNDFEPGEYVNFYYCGSDAYGQKFYFAYACSDTE